jgi:NADPH:quinone reductase-like Zn-dependent oxidoreductase
MADANFRAMVVRERDNGTFVRAVETRSVDDLPEGEVLVQVHYSSLNYKDALSATGNRGVTRHFPHTPGIDAAGVVAHSTSLRFARGDDVIVIGYWGWTLTAAMASTSACLRIGWSSARPASPCARAWFTARRALPRPWLSTK